MPSADWSAPADFTFQELAQAYFDCRRTKRNSASALAFEERLERNLRRRTFNEAISRARTTPSAGLFETANSYFGLLRQATHSHHDRASLGNALRKRGHSIKSDLTKTYRRSA